MAEISCPYIHFLNYKKRPGVARPKEINLKIITKSFIWGFLFSPIRCLHHGSPLAAAKPKLNSARTRRIQPCRIYRRRWWTRLAIRASKWSPRSKQLSATDEGEQWLRSTQRFQAAHSSPMWSSPRPIERHKARSVQHYRSFFFFFDLEIEALNHSILCVSFSLTQFIIFFLWRNATWLKSWRKGRGFNVHH